jgi:membrane protein
VATDNPKDSQKEQASSADSVPVEFKSWKGIQTFGKEVLDKFNQHDVLTLSAALAFYTALSLAPLLLITLSVVGLLGEQSQAQLIQQIQSVLGEQASTAITTIIDSAQDRPSVGSFAGIVGVVILIFSASGVFAQLQSSLNKIWEVQGQTSSGMWGLVRQRLLSMGMVISLGFIALVSLIVNTILSFLLTSEGQIWQVVNLIVTLLVFSGLFALVFKFLPDVKISWRDSFYGGLVTAILFGIGKSLIGIYLGRSAVGSAYGAAGSLIVLLVWVYYSSVIVFTGAEITRVLAARHPGSATARKDKERGQKLSSLRPQRAP